MAKRERKSKAKAETKMVTVRMGPRAIRAMDAAATRAGMSREAFVRAQMETASKRANRVRAPKARKPLTEVGTAD